MTLNDMYAVSYSAKQKCLHIEYYFQYINQNIKTIMTDNGQDYRLIGLCSTYQQANKLCDDFLKKYNLGKYSL